MGLSLHYSSLATSPSSSAASLQHRPISGRVHKCSSPRHSYQPFPSPSPSAPTSRFNNPRFTYSITNTPRQTKFAFFSIISTARKEDTNLNPRATMLAIYSIPNVPFPHPTLSYSQHLSCTFHPMYIYLVDRNILSLLCTVSLHATSFLISDICLDLSTLDLMALSFLSDVMV